MLVVEAKLKNGTPEQYQRLEEAIRTAQFVRNKCVRYWIENKGTTRNDLQKLCAILAKDSTTPWVNKLNSQARQSSADRAWNSIARFYANCRDSSVKKKGFPKFKKFSRSVEYKTTGYKLSDCGAKVYKTLSTRTHQCPHCKTVLDRDWNAAINILKKGLKYLGEYLNGTVGHTGTDPNDWGESGLFFFNRDVDDLSRLVEPVIPVGDSGRISRQALL